MRIIEGYYHPKLTNPSKAIPMAAEVMGHRLPTRIAEHDALIAMPRVIHGRKTAQVVVPPEWVHVSPDFFWPKTNDYESSEPRWGFSSGMGSGARAFVQILRIAVRADDDEDPAALADALRADLPRWWELVTSWYQLLAGHDLDPEEPAKEAAVSGLNIWTVVDGEHVNLSKGGIWARRPLRLLMDPPIRHPWGSALIKAAKNEEPPIEWTLLRESLAAYNRDQFRKSVLDAGTACELGLSILARRTAENAGEKVLGLLLDGKSLGTVLGIFNKLSGEQLPGRAVEIRNQVAHHGRSPTREDATQVLSLAFSVVPRATPSNSFEEDERAYRPRFLMDGLT